MQKLCQITVPGLDVRSDWRLVHDRLLDDFPSVTDVLATTMTETVLIVYEGAAEASGWLDSIGGVILSSRKRRRPAAAASYLER